MRLVIAAVGRLKSGPERELVGRYLERANAAGRSVTLAPLEILEIAEGHGRRAPERMAEEAEKLLAAVPKGAKIVALDAGGKALSSGDFATRLAAMRDQGDQTAVFLIGGADGLARALLEKADLKLSYGSATFPHQVVRILLTEQIYRAITILSGHPYHRA